jgi:hypothetical protein
MSDYIASVKQRVCSCRMRKKTERPATASGAYPLARLTLIDDCFRHDDATVRREEWRPVHDPLICPAHGAGLGLERSLADHSECVIRRGPHSSRELLVSRQVIDLSTWPLPDDQ